MYTEADRIFMARALQLAQRALYTTQPNPRVGCVIVHDAVVLGEGYTQPPGSNHAEVQALQDARANGHGALLRGATAYVTLEPCSHFGRTPPCANALIEIGISRVICAMQDPNPLVNGKGLEMLRHTGIDVRCGLFEREAQELNPGFVSRFTRGRPWVRLKMAATLDGRSALNNGVSQWITGEAARADGHAWRARACAVLTGIGTVRKDNPQLTVRADFPDKPAALRQPRKVVVDSRFELPLDAAVLQGAPTLVFVAHDNPAKTQELIARGAQVHVCANEQGKVDLPAMLNELAKHNVNELHLECGAKLSGAFLQADCVDELLLYLAPSLMGPGMGLAQLPELQTLDQMQRWRITQTQMVGDDVRLNAVRQAQG